MDLLVLLHLVLQDVLYFPWLLVDQQHLLVLINLWLPELLVDLLVLSHLVLLETQWHLENL